MSRDYMGKAEFAEEARAANKAEHTPGPWVQFADGGKCVAIMPAGRPGDICTFEESPSEGDARLMTAAPEMLVALQSASDALAGTLKARGYQPGSDISQWAPEVQTELRTLAAIRKVMAKAEGRQP